MNGKMEFREKLNELLKSAEAQGKKISLEEVERCFEDDALSEEKMQLVLDYLLTQKIEISGYKKAAEKEDEEEITFTDEENLYLESYLKDLKAIRKEMDGECSQLYRQAAEGDKNAKSRLTELYLEKVVDTAKELYHPEIFFGDLVQAGNVGLLLGVELIQDAEHAHETILSEVRREIQDMIEEQTESKDRDAQIVEKINMLSDTIQALTEDQGDKISIDELAAYMEMSVEEIEDILRLAGEKTEE